MSSYETVKHTLGNSSGAAWPHPPAPLSIKDGEGGKAGHVRVAEEFPCWEELCRMSNDKRPICEEKSRL